jgi:hypothetical protein
LAQAVQDQLTQAQIPLLAHLATVLFLALLPLPVAAVAVVLEQTEMA